jgi:hypothetical protein
VSFPRYALIYFLYLGAAYACGATPFQALAYATIASLILDAKTTLEDFRNWP